MENFLILLCILDSFKTRDKKFLKIIHDINNQLTYLKLESEAFNNKKIEKKIDQLILKIKDLNKQLI